MFEKGISSIISVILMLMITTALAGTTYMYISSEFTSSIQGIEIIYVSCTNGIANIMIRNLGDVIITELTVEQIAPEGDSTAEDWSGELIAGGIITYTDPCIGDEPRKCIYNIRPSSGRTVRAMVQCINSYVSTTIEINEEHILNYLNYNLEHGEGLDMLSFIFTLDGYEMLEEPIPYKTQVIEYLNSLQSDEGTWDTGQTHYVPVTAQVLMFYNRSGVEPPKSLDPFFSTVDTWEEVNDHVNDYSHSWNYWGGLWGYISCYVVYENQRPPWTEEYLNAVNTNFDDWAYSNHQRTHVIGNLLQLGEPIPRIDEVINSALGQQHTDGSWDQSETETVGMIQTLGLIRDQSSISPDLIDSAISKGLEYVRNCYKSVEHEEETRAGFATKPSEEQPKILETTMGIWALLNPESDIWFRWFAPRDT